MANGLYYAAGVEVVWCSILHLSLIIMTLTLFCYDYCIPVGVYSTHLRGFILIQETLPDCCVLSDSSTCNFLTCIFLYAKQNSEFPQFEKIPAKET